MWDAYRFTVLNLYRTYSTEGSSFSDFWIWILFKKFFGFFPDFQFFVEGEPRTKRCVTRLHSSFKFSNVQRIPKINSSPRNDGSLRVDYP